MALGIGGGQADHAADQLAGAHRSAHPAETRRLRALPGPDRAGQLVELRAALGPQHQVLGLRQHLGRGASRRWRAPGCGSGRRSATASVPPPPTTAMTAPGSELCQAQNPRSSATSPVAAAADADQLDGPVDHADRDREPLGPVAGEHPEDDRGVGIAARLRRDRGSGVAHAATLRRDGRSGPAAAEDVAGDGGGGTDVERVDAAVDRDAHPAADPLHGLLGEAGALRHRARGPPSRRVRSTTSSMDSACGSGVRASSENPASTTWSRPSGNRSVRAHGRAKTSPIATRDARR